MSLVLDHMRAFRVFDRFVYERFFISKNYLGFVLICF